MRGESYRTYVHVRLIDAAGVDSLLLYEYTIDILIGTCICSSVSNIDHRIPSVQRRLVRGVIDF
jgi:hypothetical protein